MGIRKHGRVVGLALAMSAAALAAAGCDPGEDDAVSRDPAPRHDVSPDLASAGAVVWPGETSADGASDPDVEDGRQLFLGSCTACHGTNGQGMPNQGPDLRGSALLARASDDELQAFLAGGRPVGDPLNVSGLPMPPRGGNASLSDRHLRQIVKYLRTVTAGGDVGGQI